MREDLNNAFILATVTHEIFSGPLTSQAKSHRFLYKNA